MAVETIGRGTTTRRSPGKPLCFSLSFLGGSIWCHGLLGKQENISHRYGFGGFSSFHFWDRVEFVGITLLCQYLGTELVQRAPETSFMSRHGMMAERIKLASGGRVTNGELVTVKFV